MLIRYAKMLKLSEEAILLNEAPKKCPKCDIPLSQTSPRGSKKALCFIPLGIILTAIWLLIFFIFIYKGNPDAVYTGQVAIVIILNCWPAVIMGYLGSRLPQVIQRKCIKCDWEKTYQLKSPKIHIK